MTPISKLIERARADLAAFGSSEWCLLGYEDPLGVLNKIKAISQPEDAGRLLADPDPRIRRATVSLLDSFWNRRPSNILAVIQECALNDDDMIVRGGCISILRDHIPELLAGEVRSMMVALYGEPPVHVGKPAIHSDRFYRSWLSLAPRHVEHMMQKKQAAIEGLRHSNSKVRQAAVGILCVHWKVAHEVIDELKQLAKSDPDEVVRLHSLEGVISVGLGRSNVSRFLCDLLCDTTASVKCRLTAYSGLLMIKGYPLTDLPIARCFDYDHTSLNMIDWSLVDIAPQET